MAFARWWTVVMVAFGPERCISTITASIVQLAWRHSAEQCMSLIQGVSVCIVHLAVPMLLVE